MNAAALTFDRLAYVDRLKSGGIDDEQARAHAAALDMAFRDGVATKSDVENVRRDLREVEVKLEAKIETAVATVKVDILRWLIVAQIALGGFMFAVAKLVH